MHKKTYLAIIGAVFAGTVLLTVSRAYAQPFTCSMVCGFSTTGQWYKTGEMEKILGDDKWQCLFQGGAGAEGWMRPQFIGYSRFKKKSEIVSPCKVNWNKPDRIVYQISSNPTLTNLDTWEKNITGAVLQIKDKFPSAKQIIMMAVPGGPNHERCKARDSWMHVYVDSGIARVARKKIPNVYVGLSHEVSKCSDYSDGKGHVNKAGGKALGRQAGEFYKKWDEEETWKKDPYGMKEPDYYGKSRPDKDIIDPGSGGEPDAGSLDFSKGHVKLNFGGSVQDWGDGSGYASGGQIFTFSGTPDAAGTDNAAPAEVYASVVHRGESNEPLSINLPDVPDGMYTLRLHVTDAFGGRAIDIAAEGTVIVEDLDPITDGGGEMKAVVKEVEVTVSDGNGLQIVLDDDRSEPRDVFISGLEIIHKSAGNTPVLMPRQDVRIRKSMLRTKGFLLTGRSTIGRPGAAGTVVIVSNGKAALRRRIVR